MPSRAPASPPRPPKTPTDAPDAVANNADLLAELLAGEDVHGNALRLVARWVQEGRNSLEIGSLMGELAPRVEAARGPERAAGLMGEELQRTIDGARDKGFTPPTVEDKRRVLTAIARVKDEHKPNAVMEPGIIQALARIKSADQALYAELRHELTKVRRYGVQVTVVDPLVKQAPCKLGLVPETTDDKSLADWLVEEILHRADLFIDLEGEPHLTLRHSPRKTFLLHSKDAREWLAWVSFTQLQKAAGDMALSTAVTTLSSIACQGGSNAIPVYLRAAPSPDANGYFIDLCEEKWRAVHVTAAGWSIVDEPPVRFCRSQTMRPLPSPTLGGRIDPLWNAINITKPEDQHILLALILEAWRPDTPFPLLELFWGQGSGKSDTQERLRMLIDPNAVPLRSAVYPRFGELELGHQLQQSEQIICADVGRVL
jgi:hypothetical protein